MTWEIDNTLFAKEIFQARFAVGLTVKELSEKIGISDNAYRSVESAHFEPNGKGINMSTFMACCNYMQIETYRFFRIKYRKP